MSESEQQMRVCVCVSSADTPSPSLELMRRPTASGTELAFVTERQLDLVQRVGWDVLECVRK